MELAALEQAIVACILRQDWSSALRLLDPYLDTADAAVRGCAHFYRAAVLEKRDPGAARAALQHVVEVAGLEGARAKDRLLACLQGIYYCIRTGAPQNAVDLVSLSQQLIAGNPELAVWKGRRYLAKAYLYERLAEAATDGGKGEAAEIYRQALRCAERTYEWVQANPGPWDAHDEATGRPGHDRVCQANKALVLKAEVLWALGQRDQAVEIVLSLVPAMASEHDDQIAVLFWRGRIAAGSGRLDEAREALQQAYLLSAASRRREHYRSDRIAMALGEVIVRTGDEAGLRQLLEPIFLDAARIGDAGLIDEIHTLMERVGRELYEPRT